MVRNLQMNPSLLQSELVHSNDRLVERPLFSLPWWDYYGVYIIILMGFLALVFLFVYRIREKKAKDKILHLRMPSKQEIIAELVLKGASCSSCYKQNKACEGLPNPCSLYRGPFQ